MRPYAALTQGAATRAVALLVMTGVFLTFSHPLGKGDFWWHLATGRWIVEHGSLPNLDPFSYTTAPEGTAYDPAMRQAVILQGFWLSQVFYYAVYSAFGLAGIAVVKASFFTFLFYLLYRTMTSRGLEDMIALALVAPLAALSVRFDEMRPQMFSFLGVLVFHLVIDRGLGRLRAGGSLGRYETIGLPAVMLLWANLHRGFILGYAIIGAYIAGEGLRLALRREPLGRRAALSAALWLGAAASVSLLNPNHIHTLSVNLWELTASISTGTIDEYLSLGKYAAYVGSPYLYPGVLALGAVGLAAIALPPRRMDPSHFLLLIGSFAASLSSFRFAIFFIVLAAATASRGLAGAAAWLPSPHWRPRAFALAALLAGCVLVYSSGRSSFILQGTVAESVPSQAADFILARSLPPNVYNDYGFGGYLIWRFSSVDRPAYRVFIDGRALDNNALLHYMSAMMGHYEPLFSGQAVNTVVLAPFHSVTLNIPPLLFSLLGDPAWRLAWYDGTAVIFVRARARPTLTALDKSILWDALETTARSFSARKPESRAARSMLAQVLAAQGRTDEAENLLDNDRRSRRGPHD